LIQIIKAIFFGRMEKLRTHSKGFTEMRSYFAPAIAIAMIMPSTLSARSDDVPTLDVRPVCRGIAKSHCVTLAKTGGESSYTELITCLEMARDVRALRSAEANPSRTTTTGTPSSHSTPTMPAARPTPPPTQAPADSTSQPSSSKEPPNTGVDSTLKELERVKADALNARASEATVRGKLASTADLQRAKQELQRTKDEAERATKETEQAKDDAQSAREAQAKAENKLADV
jgi:hypothetical protein